MIVNMHDAKTNFSKYVAQVLDGEEVIVAKKGKPLVKITPLRQLEAPRVPGLSQSKITSVSDDFDDLLEDSILSEFEK